MRHATHFICLIGFTLWILVVLSVMPLSAQEGSGHGVVLYIDTTNVKATGFEARPCYNANCARLENLLYPMLFADDPATGLIGAGPADGSVLITNPPVLPAAEQIYTLGDGNWSDGTPITAFDVAYSLLRRESLRQSGMPAPPIAGMRIEDEHDIRLAFSEPSCATQVRINGEIIPAHIYAPYFRAFAEWFMEEDEGLPSLYEWQDGLEVWEKPGYLTYPAIPVTGGGQFSYLPGTERDVSYIRQGELVLGNFVPNYTTGIERFVQTDANLLLDPPFEQRADLRATPGLQLYEAPGYAVDYLVFNESDPNYPRDAFVDGEPLEQLPHPYFSDVRVRQAIQLAIDVPALIDSALYGGGVPVNGAYPPAAWAYDPDLPLSEYDPAQAKQLLDEAGWRDIDGDGWRECYRCLYASSGIRLSINLEVNDYGDGVRLHVGDILRAQLARIGVELYIGQEGNGWFQDFDLLLTGTDSVALAGRDPDLYRQFAREWDRIGLTDGNVGSANHPELEAILDEARRVPGCAIDERAVLYREAQILLREEVPAIWLYARNDFYAARGIAGFAPLPGDPFWNVSEWRVAR